MSLFGFGSSDDCTHHHYEVRRRLSDWKVVWNCPHYELKQKVKYRCAHEGCHSYKEGWKKVGRYYVEKDGNGDFEDDGMEQLGDVLQFFKSEVNS